MGGKRDLLDKEKKARRRREKSAIKSEILNKERKRENERFGGTDPHLILTHSSGSDHQPPPASVPPPHAAAPADPEKRGEGEQYILLFYCLACFSLDSGCIYAFAFISSSFNF